MDPLRWTPDYYGCLLWRLRFLVDESIQQPLVCCWFVRVWGLVWASVFSNDPMEISIRPGPQQTPLVSYSWSVSCFHELLHHSIHLMFVLFVLLVLFVLFVLFVLISGMELILLVCPTQWKASSALSIMSLPMLIEHTELKFVTSAIVLQIMLLHDLASQNFAILSTISNLSISTISPCLFCFVLFCFVLFCFVLFEIDEFSDISLSCLCHDHTYDHEARPLFWIVKLFHWFWK